MSGARSSTSRGHEVRRTRGRAPAEELDTIDESLLDLVDHVLTKGVVITGELVLGVADIDLIYLRLSAVLCAADRILPPSQLPDRVMPERPEGAPPPPRRRPVIAKKFGAPKLRPKPA